MSTIKTWQDIPGFFDFMDIYDLAVNEAKDGDMLVEVGSFLGKSAAYMADRIRESKKRVRFYAVDSWNPAQYGRWWEDLKDDPPSPWPVEELKGKPLYDAFAWSIRHARAVDLIRPLRMTSVNAADTFLDHRLFFVFIDADHRYPGISSDIKAWRSKIKPGGIIAGHDYKVQAWPDVERAVDEAFGIDVEHRGNCWFVRHP